jgi:hypothetical protein
LQCEGPVKGSLLRTGAPQKFLHTAPQKT